MSNYLSLCVSGYKVFTFFQIQGFRMRLKTEIVSYQTRRCVCKWQHETKTFRFRDESGIFRSSV